MRVDFVVGPTSEAGRDLPGTELGQRRLIGDLSREPQFGAQCRPVLVGGEKILPDTRRRVRVGPRLIRYGRGWVRGLDVREIYVLVELGNGEVDVRLGQPKHVVCGKRRGDPRIIVMPPEHSKADAVLFDDQAS